jgi:hypothetical protein
MTTIGIIQPNFVPWRGYFDFINEVDIFVFLDDVQYTSQDWRNRNRIRTKAGPSRWLTVPVNASLHDRICDVRIDPNDRWRRTHAAILRENYRQALFLEPVLAMLDAAYARHGLLAELNIDLCNRVLQWLDIRTPLVRSSLLRVDGKKDQKLIKIVKVLGGDRYLSGPAASAYLDPPLWQAEGIVLDYKTYPDYPVYRQIAEPYDPRVSILDLLMMTGEQANQYL